MATVKGNKADWPRIKHNTVAGAKSYQTGQSTQYVNQGKDFTVCTQRENSSKGKQNNTAILYEEWGLESRRCACGDATGDWSGRVNCWQRGNECHITYDTYDWKLLQGNYFEVTNGLEANFTFTSDENWYKSSQLDPAGQLWKHIEVWKHITVFWRLTTKRLSKSWSDERIQWVGSLINHTSRNAY